MSLGIVSRLSFVVVVATAGLLLLRSAQDLFGGEMLGGDYTFFVPRLAYGYFWFVENGLKELPWFVPGFCGGLPFYADPQVMLFSIPQLLIFFVEPLLAILVTFLFFGALGALGMYLFCRQLDLQPWFCLLAATLFLFNEFFLARMLAGHFTYHVFPLIPLISWLIVRESRSRLLSLLLAGVLIAYFVHAGALNYLIPGMASVFGLLLLHYMLKQQAQVFGDYLLAGTVGFFLSLSKLSATFAFARFFPREGLSLGLFDGVQNTLVAVFTTFFMSPWVALDDMKIGYIVQQHELRFGLSLVPLLLFCLGLWRLPKLLRQVTFTRSLALLALLLLVTLPLVLSVRSEFMNDLLKSLPYFREMSLASRWLGLLIPVFIVAPILMFTSGASDEGRDPRVSGVVLVFCFALLGLSHLFFEKTGDDYLYSPADMNAAVSSVRAGGAVPTVATVVAHEGQASFSGVDDSYLTGGSSLICYQSLFGYGLETYPIGSLIPGSIFMQRGDRINLKNPACYLFPEENNCYPGDQFTIAQEEQAARFATNQPYNWKKAWWQTAADLISLAAAVLVLLGMLGSILQRLISR